MKVLITGSSGFIGRNLIERGIGLDLVTLDKAGSADCCVDLSCVDANTVVENFKDKLSGVSSIVHLASNSRPRLYTDEHASSDISTFQTLCELAEILDVKTIIHSSSSSVYGEDHEASEHTSSRSLRPISQYGKTKLQIELMLEDWCKKTGRAGTNLRFFNVVGKWQKAGTLARVIPEKLINDELIPIFGVKTRTHTYVGDVVRAIQASVNLFSNVPKALCLTLNVGSGQSISTLDLVYLYSRLLDIHPLYEVHEPNENDPTYTKSDNFRFHSLFGWSPQVLTDSMWKETYLDLKPKVV